MDAKSTNPNQKIILLLYAFKSSWCMERFLRYDQICVEKLPLTKIRKKQVKKWNFLISASNYQRYTKFTSKYMFFVGEKCDEIS